MDCLFGATVAVKVTEVFWLVCIDGKESFKEIFDRRLDGFGYHFC